MKAILDAAQEGRWLYVNAIFQERRDLTLRFEELSQTSRHTSSAWLVLCRQVRDLSLTNFDGGGLNLWDRDHPVASQFSSPKGSLAIRLQTRTRADVQAFSCARIAARLTIWIDFDRFVRPQKWLDASGDRVALSGPEFLLLEYQRQLTRDGFSNDLKEHKRKLYWSGFGWSEQRHSVSVLHFGTSFVAAEGFSEVAETARHVRPHALAAGGARRS